MIDVNKVLEVDIVNVISAHVTLTHKGGEYVGLCPFHDDHAKSLQVNQDKQVYKCFACGAGGDSIDFLMRLGANFKEACNEITGGDYLKELTPEQRTVKPKQRPQWRPVLATAQADNFTHYRHGQPSSIWPYYNKNGALLGYVCRFNMADGSKEVIPYTYCTDGRRWEWRWQGFDTPRPLYGLDLLATNPDKTVLLVEGEKCADAVNAAAPTVVGVAWPGGANGIKLVDWSPLNGRNVILWPDHDTEQRYGEKHEKAGQLKPWYEQPGNAAMLEISKLINAKVRKWVNVPSNYPHKWDCADRQWKPGEMAVFVRSHLIDMPDPNNPPPFITDQPEPEPEPEPPQLQPEPPDMPPHYFDAGPPPDEPDDTNNNTEDYFQPLGFDKTDSGVQAFYFFANGGKTLVRLTASQLTISNLLTLAPLEFWEDNFPNRADIDVKGAANSLIAACNSIGMFNGKKVRGRGAWLDAGRVVIHCGNKLIVDGRPVALGTIDSRYIYEAGEELDINLNNPLNVKEANKLIEVTKLLNWERDINAYLLAGWCVVAPICGALNWRPHIWLTGAAGTGKSWVFLKIVRRLMGRVVLAVQSETSEAGLRQTLHNDAMPVVFDEAEGEDRRAQDRMQSVLALMRAASADDGGIMAKGTAGGTSKHYQIRSCFAFASIGVQVAQQSDRSRVTVLALKRPVDDTIKQQRWEQLQEAYDDVINEAFVERLHARTIMLLPVIIENAHTFANAAAAVLGEQRLGDQLGALLAGAYSLHSDRRITYDEAVKWVSDKEWTEERGLSSTRDELALLDYILDQITRVETAAGVVERTIGELIMIVAQWKFDTVVTDADLAADRLKRLGIRVLKFENQIIISNSSKHIIKMLEGTPWAKNHNKILRRIDGAIDIDSTSFGSYLRSRGVAIPLDIIGNES